MILLIGLLGLFGAGAFNSLEHFVGSVAPHGVISMIDFAKKDAAQNKSASAIAFAFGVIVALWAASGAMGAIVRAVNRAYDRLETRPFWKVRLISLVLVVATGLVLAGTFLLIVFGGSLGDAIARRTPLGGGFKVFWNIARWPVAFCRRAALLRARLLPGAEQGAAELEVADARLAGRLAAVAGAVRPVRSLHELLGLVRQDVRRH